MSRRTSRRQFLKTTGAAASAALLSNSVLRYLDGGTSAFAAPVIRRNVKGMTASDPIIVAYKAGINAMKALPSTDPRNWTNWANIHGVLLGSGPQWRTCQHGQWWFLPWHRMYLLFFERIIRKLSNTPSFTLPFWNYSDPLDATQAILPLMFRTPTTGNALYVSQRVTLYNRLLNPGALPPAVIDITTAMGKTNFTSAAGTSNNFGSQTVAAPSHFTSPHGALEHGPHDLVHSTLGGWMGDPNTAARDPIFWLHHCNIDRLWNAWLAKGGGRSDPGTKAWCNQKFNFFDENGNAVSMDVRQVINAAAQLNYVYEGEPAIPTQSCPLVLQPVPLPITTAAASFSLSRKTIVNHAVAGTLTAGRTRVSLPLPKTLNARATTMEAIAQPERSLVLRIEGITVDRSPDTVWEVYVGLPADAKPDPTGPHFVGVLPTFGALGHGGSHAGGFTVAFEIGAAMAAAIEGNAANTNVTFVPLGVEVDGQRVTQAPKTNVHFTRLRVVEEPQEASPPQ
jgi:tyrosinase